MIWYSIDEFKPPEYLSILVFMPGEEPLPTVHEGYMTPDEKFWANGFYRSKSEIALWGDMPEANKSKSNLVLEIEKSNFIAALKSHYRKGYENGYNACMAELEERIQERKSKEKHERG